MKQKLFSMLLLGACFLASVSVFTSCSDDYDDDIKALKAENVSLRSELETVKQSLEAQLLSEKSTFETQIAAVKAELQAAIDKKADEATVSALKSQLQQLEIDYAAKIAVLTTQIETATEAIAKLDQKADKATVDAVMADLAALTGKLSDESKAREAVEANLRIQTEALEKLKKEISDANYQGQIDAILLAIQKFETSENAEKMRADMNALQQMIVNVNENMDALNVLIERMLNSISLVPSLFIDGIEAIEFTSLEYKPFKNLDFFDFFNETKCEDRQTQPSGTLSNHDSNSLLESNGLTEATYRLNPTTVQRDGIDENNIDFLAARAETRGAAEIIESPVAFKGIKSYSNGLMTVYMEKKTTASLNENGNKITIVALKVPRNPEKYEPADVISENSRLAEISYTPRIAALDDNGKFIFDKKDKIYHGIWTAEAKPASPEDVNKNRRLQRPHHYWSYFPEKIKGPNVNIEGVYFTRIDANPSWEGVAKDIVYNESFDLTKIVTGCLMVGDYDTGECQREITKEELKKYGLVFEFDIPTKPYKDVPNGTDQQTFASVTKEGIITSKTPEGLTNNEAVVGKEPIVRVTLKDEKNNKIVDARYFKVKWVLTDPTLPPPPPEVQLADYNSKDVVMNWCSTTVIDSIDWNWWVNQIYAKLKDLDYNNQEIEGMAQHHFKEIYGDKPSEIKVTFTTNWNPTTDTNAPSTGTSSGIPVWRPTGNEHGDALAAIWSMEPQDIETVYCNSQNDTKTFTAKIYFKSSDSRFPNIWFNWKATVKMPPLSKINGFYEQYWLENEVGKKHDIMPVQYNTEYQRNLGNTYCLYHNNLMNPFTYYQGDPNQHFIVTPFPECGSWDLQFNYDQKMSGYHAAYEPGKANATEYIWKSAGTKVDTKHQVDWRDFGAYRLNQGGSNEGGVKALEMLWDQDHFSWCGNPTHYQTYLFADHNNSANQGLLNPLGQNNIRAKDGSMVPERTHDKPIDLTVWVCMNAWNYVPVLKYQAFMVAPIRIDWKNDLGPWYEGYVNGYSVDLTPQFTCTDFRGYLVANDMSDDSSNPNEQKRYTKSLWDYYEIQTVVPDTANIKYAFKEDRTGTHNVVIDESASPNWMSAQKLRQLTNGNIDYSMVWGTGRFELKFYNNGGSNVEKPVRVKIPVKVTYGFGTLQTDLIGWIYPRQ